jgi:hypothetical protein
MSLDTSDLRAWYREDIQNILSAIVAASSGMTPDERRGFITAIVAMCYAVGINPESIKYAKVHDGQS